MIEAAQSITLSEWETRGPTGCEELAGRFLDESEVSRGVASTLAASRLLELTELRGGLKIKACSHVGRIQIGDLNVTVLPMN